MAKGARNQGDEEYSPYLTPNRRFTSAGRWCPLASRSDATATGRGPKAACLAVSQHSGLPRTEKEQRLDAWTQPILGIRHRQRRLATAEIGSLVPYHLTLDTFCV